MKTKLLIKSFLQVLILGQILIFFNLPYWNIIPLSVLVASIQCLVKIKKQKEQEERKIAYMRNEFENKIKRIEEITGNFNQTPINVSNYVFAMFLISNDFEDCLDFLESVSMDCTIKNKIKNYHRSKKLEKIIK